jgi:hypothetical protein
MPKFSRSEFKHNAKVFEKVCLWCATPYLASRTTAKYCTSTCRAYAAQARVSNEMAPWPEEERTIDAMLHQIAHLKLQLAQAYRDMDMMRQQYEEKIKSMESSAGRVKATSEK